MHFSTIKRLIFIFALVSIANVALSQERRPLSVADIEELISAGVSHKRVVEIIGDRGVNFELTEEIRARLKRAGAEAAVMQAVERSAFEFARRKLEEERRKVEGERRRIEEVKQKEEAKRKAEEQTRGKAEEVSRGALEDAARFYQGKTIRIVVGFAPGGGFDTYSRVIARHLGNHIPGAPSIIIQNMTGAGSLIAANYVYKVAMPDGLTLGNFTGGLVSLQLLGWKGIEFDARKFEWIGTPAKDNVVCALTRASGVTSMERWMASNTPVKLGGIASGTTTDDIPKILRATLGLPIDLVPGHKGTADIRLAADGGNIAGGCWAWESIKLTWRQALESGNVNIVLQAVPRPLNELRNVPLAISFARTEEARKLIEAGIHDTTVITRPYVLPPGTPRERVQILRRAFQSTMADPAFLAEAAKSRLDIDLLPGEEVERTVHRLLNLEPTLLTRLKEILR